MNKPPAFQFYPKDFVSDLNVASMTMEERGQYITLLSHCWIEDGIPISSPLVKQWLKKGSILEGCFYKKNGKIRNKRLDEEREKQIAWAEKSSKGGKKTQGKRWEGVKKESRGERLAKAKEKGIHTEKEWELIKKICNYKCVKCGIDESKLHGEKLCKDHVIPICLSGSDAIENIQPICRNCNTAKTNDQTDYRPKNWKLLLTNSQPMANSSSSSSSSSSITIKNKEKNKPIVLQIINHLNEKAKTNYSPKTKITTEYINGRIADGFKLDDFFYVIDVKCEDWIGDLEMEKFLRPKTLFATSNFEGYLNQKRERKGNYGVGGQGDNKKISALFEKQKREGDFDGLDDKEE